MNKSFILRVILLSLWLEDATSLRFYWNNALRTMLYIHTSGLHMRIPFLQKPKRVDHWERTHKKGKFIELTEQILDTAPRQCVTKDNATVDISCIIRWRITDPIKALYEVENLHKSLTELVLNEVRSIIGSRNLDELLSSRSELSEKIVLSIATTATRWGLSITSVEIQELTADKETQKAMLEQMKAERISRALRLNAQAERDAAIMRAEGAKEAMRLIAEADAAYVNALARTLGADGAMKALINRQTLEGYATITKNDASKVYLPANVPAMINIKEGE
jgi:regulator of protease activity HflC (stomatin/prohibitin superfamily)